MQLTDIALKNLQRRKSKMLFLVFGMVFGIATIVTLFTLTNAMEKSIAKKIEETGIKLAVTPKTETVSFSVGGIPVVSGVSYEVKELSSDTVDKISSIKGSDKLKVVAPKVMGAAQVKGEKVLAVGVDFPSEFKIKSWWEISGGGRPDKAGEVLVGSRAAGKLGLKVGETFEANGQSLTVSGILAETGEEEDGIVFLNIEDARKVLGKKDNYSFIEVVTVKDEKVAGVITAEIARQVRGAKVSVVKEAAEARQELVGNFSKFSLVVSVIMVIISTLIVTTTMMAAVKERTREIGIFRAIGFRKAHVSRILLTEAGIICGISGIVGYLAGMGVATLIAPLFNTFELKIYWNPFLGLAVLAGAVALGLLASLYPASRASKLDPTEALRFI